jgi:redox-sensitive bicupin YhaK (pirin superfamily)
MDSRRQDSERTGGPLPGGQARTVERVITPQTVLEGAGVRLRRSIATPALDYVDPFLLFDHFGSDEPSDYMAGFPWHPHRGIETVTYMLAGEVDHRDSIGNAGRIGPGDVQWMTAGGGIMHEEMPRPGPDRRMGGFQLWVNLPAALKMSHPRYQDLGAAEIPEVRRDDGVVIRVVAGEVDGVRGAVTEIYAEPEYLDVSLPGGARFVQPVPRGHAALAYAFEGEGRFGVAGDLGYRGELDGVLLAAPELAVFGDGDEVRVEAGPSPVRFLLVSGRPLNEPIARYGPFVMNTREELQIALRDLQGDAFVWRDDPEWAASRRTWSPGAAEV